MKELPYLERRKRPRLHRWACAALAAAALHLATGPADASDSQGESAIRTAYAALQNALFTNDAAGLAAILAPDFLENKPDGSVEARDAYVKQQTEATPGLTLASLQLVADKVAVRGNVAQAEAAYTYSGTYAVHGVRKPFRGTMHVSDGWTLTSGTWKLRTSTVHDETSYVDGKVVQDEREQVAPNTAAITELRTRAVLIPTLALDADPDQFAAIGAAIGNARLVGMGEGSHGSSEFFAFKNRLFKYLVEKQGFTILAMEAHWGAGLYGDRYIKTGQGSAQQAVASLGFWTWDAPEVVDLVQWMRDYNAASGKHPILSFVGIDMQDPMGAIGYLAQYLNTHDPAAFRAARPALACSANASVDVRAKPTDGCRQQVAELGKQLSAFGDAPDSAVAQEAVTNILQYLDSKSVPFDGRTQTRDFDMANNVEWAAVRYTGEKIALWAHNGHVGTTSELSYRPMGTYLRQAFGTQYYAIGQTFGGGTVRGVVRTAGLQSVSVPSNPADTIVALFAPLNAAAFLNLRGLPAGSALQTFFSTPHGVDEIGAMIDPLHPADRLPMVVPNSFDGLVYVPTSTATVSGTASAQMRRDIAEGGTGWKIAGVGFDDAAVSATATQATLANRDGINATPSFLTRRFDAQPYAGQTIRVTGEIQAGDLLGFAFPIAEARGPGGKVVTVAQGSAIDTTKGGDWVPMTLTLKVPQDALSIEAGFWARDFGSVAVRNLTLTLPDR